MVPFRQFINEIRLDQPHPYKWVKQTRTFWDGEFTTENGVKIEVEFSHYLSSENQAIWDFGFSYHTSELEAIRQKKGMVYFPTYGIGGTGDAIGVFATVVAMLRDFVKQHKNAVIEFEAKEPQRIKLYDIFLQRIREVLPGYVGKKLTGNAFSNNNGSYRIWPKYT